MTHYVTLGIERNSTEEEIKKGYREKALQFHPDRNKGSEDEAAVQFKKITAAFDVLNDFKKKQIYDSKLPKPPKKAMHKPKNKKPEHNDLSMYNAPPPTRDIWGTPLAPEDRKIWAKDLKTDIRDIQRQRPDIVRNRGPKLMYEDELYYDDPFDV